MEKPLLPSIITFLKAVKKNNNREWFLEHKATYTKLHRAFKDWAQGVTALVSDFDPRVANVLGEPKLTKIFRIYRDARFSNDKTPYKTNFGMSIAPGGMMSGHAGYYVHIEPGASFIAGGVYMPDKEKLGSIRDAIIKNPAPLKAILESPEFIQVWGELNQEGALKTAPRGIAKDHPEIQLLRLKSFTVTKELSDKEVLSESYIDTLLDSFKALEPLCRVLGKMSGV